MKDLKELTRPNIWALKPYSSARDEYNGAEASVFLDANENPYNTPNNRYPDPMQRELKNMIAPIKKVDPDTIFLGNGSDEAIDLVYRAFCIPGVDNVVAIDPTYGMYQVCADVNDVEYRKVLLDENYQFSADKLLAATDDHTKLVFLCSPNNPTGNNLDRREMEKLLDTFQGLVIIDEAYSDFSDAPSFLADLDKYPNLISNSAASVWFTALYCGQLVYLDKNISNKKEMTRWIYANLRKCIDQDNCKNELNWKQRLWIDLANINFDFTCKMRMILKIGL